MSCRLVLARDGEAWRVLRAQRVPPPLHPDRCRLVAVDDDMDGCPDALLTPDDFPELLSQLTDEPKLERFTRHGFLRASDSCRPVPCL